MASSKRIQFFKGTKVRYDLLTTGDDDKKSIIENGIYFCTDRKTIMTGGLEYGGFDKSIFDGVVMNLKVENGVLTYDTVVAGQTEHRQTNLTLVTNKDNSINVEHNADGGVNVSVKVKTVNAGEDGIKLDTDGLYVDLTKTNKKIADETSARTTAIQGMSLASTGGTGKYITTIAQANGKVTATAADLTSVNVKRTATSGVSGQVDMTGTTVENALVDLAKAVDSTQKAAATYSIEKVTTGLGANVKEAYQLVQTVDGKKSYVNVQIPIYKDRSLKSVELTETNDKGAKGQFMKYTYNLDDETAEVVYVNVSKLLHESEFKNGLQVSDSGEVSIKLDANNENEFLTVSTDGVKLSGVQAAINTAKNEVIDGASAGYNTLKGLEDKLKDEAGKIVVLNGNVDTDGSVAKTVNDAITPLQQNITEVSTKANQNTTAIDGLKTELSKANAIEVKGSSGITVTPSTDDSDNHKIFTVSGASFVTKTEYNKLNILSGNGSISVSGDKAQGYTISNTASNDDTKVANEYVTSVSQSNGVITVERAQPDAKEIKYTKAEATSSITSTTVQGALEEIDHDLQWIDAGTF